MVCAVGGTQGLTVGRAMPTTGCWFALHGGGGKYAIRSADGRYWGFSEDSPDVLALVSQPQVFDVEPVSKKLCRLRYEGRIVAPDGGLLVLKSAEPSEKRFFFRKKEQPEDADILELIRPRSEDRLLVEQTSLAWFFHGAKLCISPAGDDGAFLVPSATGWRVGSQRPPQSATLMMLDESSLLVALEVDSMTLLSVSRDELGVQIATMAGPSEAFRLVPGTGGYVKISTANKKWVTVDGSSVTVGDKPTEFRIEWEPASKSPQVHPGGVVSFRHPSGRRIAVDGDAIVLDVRAADITTRWLVEGHGGKLALRSIASGLYLRVQQDTLATLVPSVENEVGCLFSPQNDGSLITSEGVVAVADESPTMVDWIWRTPSLLPWGVVGVPIGTAESGFAVEICSDRIFPSIPYFHRSAEVRLPKNFGIWSGDEVDNGSGTDPLFASLLVKAMQCIVSPLLVDSISEQQVLLLSSAITEGLSINRNMVDRVMEEVSLAPIDQHIFRSRQDVVIRDVHPLYRKSSGVDDVAYAQWKQDELAASQKFLCDLAFKKAGFGARIRIRVTAVEGLPPKAMGRMSWMDVRLPGGRACGGIFTPPYTLDCIVPINSLNGSVEIKLKRLTRLRRVKPFARWRNSLQYFATNPKWSNWAVFVDDSNQEVCRVKMEVGLEFGDAEWVLSLIHI